MVCLRNISVDILHKGDTDYYYYYYYYYYYCVVYPARTRNTFYSVDSQITWVCATHNGTSQRAIRNI
jgi:hypothetical protein